MTNWADTELTESTQTQRVLKVGREQSESDGEREGKLARVFTRLTLLFQGESSELGESNLELVSKREMEQKRERNLCSCCATIVCEGV